MVVLSFHLPYLTPFLHVHLQLIIAFVFPLTRKTEETLIEVSSAQDTSPNPPEGIQVEGEETVPHYPIMILL